MKFLRTAVAIAGMSLIGSIAWAQTAKMSAQDFTTMAASSDMFEIRSSELALQKSQKPAVKQFAQMMIKDHTTSSKNLMAAAQQDGVKVPAEMTQKHAGQFKTLSSTDAQAFDAAYVEAQLAGHQEAVMLMTSFAKTGDGGALQAHAQKTAPVVQMHLEHLQQMQKGD